MEIKDAIFGRRSVRKYLPRAVEREKLEAVLRAGSYAPSAMNNMSRQFVAITKPELLAALNKAVEKTADEGLVKHIKSRSETTTDKIDVT